MLRHLLFGSKPHRDFSGFCPRPNIPFPEVPYKSSIRGREQRYLRPRVALPAAESSTNCGREQTTSPYRTKGTDWVVAEICQRRSVCPLPTRGAKAGQDASSHLWPNAAILAPSPLLHHAPSALLFLLFIIYNQRKEK